MATAIALTPELQENFRKLSEKMKKVGKALEKNPLCQAFCETTGSIEKNPNPRAAKFQLMQAHVKASRDKNRNPQTVRDLFKLAKDFWRDASNPNVFIKKAINRIKKIVSPIVFTHMKTSSDPSDDSDGSGGDDDPDGDDDDSDHHRQIAKPLPHSDPSIPNGGAVHA